MGFRDFVFQNGYGEDLVFDDKGEAELTIDVESEKLAASTGSVMLFLNKYATAGEKDRNRNNRRFAFLKELMTAAGLTIC